MVAVAGIVPVSAGLAGVVLGPAMADAVVGGGTVSLDSHFRYLSGLLLAIGLAFWSMIPRIESRGPAFRLLSVVVVTGGLGRLLGLVLHGTPSTAMLFGLTMELVVTPLLCLWQSRIADDCRVRRSV